MPLVGITMTTGEAVRRQGRPRAVTPGRVALWGTGCLVLMGACGKAPTLPPAPSINAPQIALRQEAATRPERPLRAVFNWRINEGGARFSGQGVIRMEPPYKARLDLFLGNGEPVLQAALVDDDLRIPPGAPPGLVPPAPLLWVSLGVFRPGPVSGLVGGEAIDSTGAQLHYQFDDGEEATFTFTGDRVTEGEILRDGRVEEALSVEWGEDSGRVPVATVYRNIAAFRELEIDVESHEFVESFPPDIWSIGR